MAMDFFTSDLHLTHEKMVKVRGFNSCEEMDRAIHASINQTCGPDDTLYLLGDTTWDQHHPRFHELMSSISPKLVLILGNHDLIGKRGHLSWDKYLTEIHQMLVRGFGTGPEKQMVHMCHYPLAHWFAQNKGIWHLHGHLHGSPSMIPGKIMDVGWDIFRRPISFAEIKEHMDKLPIRANHHSGVWFD